MNHTVTLKEESINNLLPSQTHFSINWFIIISHLLVMSDSLISIFVNWNCCCRDSIKLNPPGRNSKASIQESILLGGQFPCTKHVLLI